MISYTSQFRIMTEKLKKSNNLIKLSDYLVSYLVDLGIRDVFMITGGNAMHLNESFGSNSKIRYFCNHHEQASAMAAESYTRLSGKLSVCVVTAGPGGTNTLTGLIGSWLDSIPTLFISGQPKLETTIGKSKVRQIGIQELPIVSMVKPVTKYAVTVTKPQEIRCHLEKAVYLAMSGRPGPVWIDIPLDIQAARVNPALLKPFNPREVKFDLDSQGKVKKKVAQTVKLIFASKRPLILAGNGVRLAGAVDDFGRLIQKLNIPVVTGITAHDLIPSDHRLFLGRPGIFGERVGNFVVQNCDLLISIGSRLSIWVVSFSYKTFAREAKHVMIDIDKAELVKKTVHADLPICADAKVFIKELSRQIKNKGLPSWDLWHDYCKRIRKKYLPVLPEQKKQKKYVNSYYFIDILSDVMKDDEVIVVGDGTAFTCTYQCIRLKKNQRLIGNVGCASMGYDLPAAIGACIANSKKRVICLAGDGSIQLNIQELQTIVHHRLPIKIFVLNNDGYLAIRITQENFFKGHYVGANPKSGISFPDMQKIAYAYGIPSIKIENHKNLKRQLKYVLSKPGPFICEIMMGPKQPLIPKVTSYVRSDGKVISKPMEDMYPFLPREEFLKNMIIKPIDEE